MPAVDSRSAALARSSKKRQVSISGAGVAVAITTGIATLTAGFLDDLEPGDLVTLSAITGGGTMLEGDYYLLANQANGPLFALGATTCKLSLTPGGDAVVPSVAITAGTLTKGKSTGTDANYGPSPLSARNRA